MKLSPSMLSVDPFRMGEILAAVAPHVGSWHVDVMDGRFAPAFGFGAPMVEALVRRGDAPVDVHLMIDRPDAWSPRFAALGVRSVAFHVEADVDAASVARAIRSEGAEATIALQPGTPVEAARHLFDAVDGCLLLTAPAGGGPFDPTALLKVFELPAHLVTIVDGRIDESHFDLLHAADVTDVVIGQALFGADHPSARGAALAASLERLSTRPDGRRRQADLPRRAKVPGRSSKAVR